MSFATEHTELTENLGRFLSRHEADFENERVDYLGVNVSSDRDGAPLFKIYYNDRASRERSHVLIDFLRQKEMIRYLTMVEDRPDLQRLRFDVGLKNRTDQNMQEVFDWLNAHTEMYGLHGGEVRRLSSMKVTELPDYHLAGLYFLGFISVCDRITVLKFHFFNRICMDPDVLHKNLRFADDYYLAFLADCGIPEFKELSGLADSALRNCGGHLWMTGADYALSGEKKYKIYIKEPRVLYEGLRETFAGERGALIRDRIRDVEAWNGQNPRFYCEGFAICEDEKAVVSINFYFKARKGQEEKRS